MSRVKIHSAEPLAYNAMLGLEKYLGSVDLPGPLLELVRLRASQINGCAYCVQLHSMAALEHDETQARLFAVSAWQESPLFSDKERAALALTDEVTRISRHGVSDGVYSSVQEHFSETQVAQLIMAIATVNAWNRIAVATHAQ